MCELRDTQYVLRSRACCTYFVYARAHRRRLVVSLRSLHYLFHQPGENYVNAFPTRVGACKDDETVANETPSRRHGRLAVAGASHRSSGRDAFRHSDLCVNCQHRSSRWLASIVERKRAQLKLVEHETLEAAMD